MQTIRGIWMRNLSLRKVSETEGVLEQRCDWNIYRASPESPCYEFLKKPFRAGPSEKTLYVNKAAKERRSFSPSPGVHLEFIKAHLVSKRIINDSITSQTRHDWLRLIMRASTKPNLMARHKRYIKFTFLPHYVRWRLGNRERKKAMKQKTFPFRSRKLRQLPL